MQTRLLWPQREVFDVRAELAQHTSAFGESGWRRQCVWMDECQQVHFGAAADLPNNVETTLQDAAMRRVWNDLGEKQYLHAKYWG